VRRSRSVGEILPLESIVPDSALNSAVAIANARRCAVAATDLAGPEWFSQPLEQALRPAFLP
jgi:hypothetical protein